MMKHVRCVAGLYDPVSGNNGGVVFTRRKVIVMAYCRWSAGSCDLCCYKSGEEYFTHVAGSRVVGKIPKVDDWLLLLDGKHIKKFQAQREWQYHWLLTCKRKPIDGPHDNETFVDRTLEGFRDRLLTLRDAGYRFPQDVFDLVDAEIREASCQS